MKMSVCLVFLCAAGVMAATQDVQCVGVKGHALLLTGNGRTGMFRLVGAMLPGTTPKELDAFVRRCFVTDAALRDFLPSVTTALTAYVGQALKITDTAGHDVWLETADGQSVSCALVAKGVAAVSPATPVHYRNQLLEACGSAVKEKAGVWSLPARGEVASGLRFKCTARTDDDSATKEKQNLSTFSAADKLITQKRVIELAVDATNLKRGVALNIRYQFKLVELNANSDKGDGRAPSTTPVQSLEVPVLPGETKKIECKSDEVTIMRHTGTDGAKLSYTKGTSFESEMLSVTCDGKEIFAKGKIEQEPAAAGNAAPPDEESTTTRKDDSRSSKHSSKK